MSRFAPSLGTWSVAESMPPWLPRAMAMFFGGVVLLLAGQWLLSRLSSLILMLVVSLFLSFALEPAVDWLAQRGWRRGSATGLVLAVPVRRHRAVPRRHRQARRRPGVGVHRPGAEQGPEHRGLGQPHLRDEPVQRQDRRGVQQPRRPDPHLRHQAGRQRPGVQPRARSAWCSSSSRSCCSPSTWSPTGPASGAPSARSCARTANARCWPTGRSPSRRPVATSTPACCWAGCRPSSTTWRSSSSACPTPSPWPCSSA